MYLKQKGREKLLSSPLAHNLPCVETASANTYRRYPARLLIAQSSHAVSQTYRTIDLSPQVVSLWVGGGGSKGVSATRCVAPKTLFFRRERYTPESTKLPMRVRLRTHTPVDVDLGMSVCPGTFCVNPHAIALD